MAVGERAPAARGDSAGLWRVAAQTTDLEEIQDAVQRALGPHKLGPTSGVRSVDAVGRVAEIGRLRLVRLRYGADVAIEPDASTLDSVLVEMPLSGHSEVSSGGRSVMSTPSLATVLTPHLRTRLTYSDDCEKLIVRIERDRLARHWLALTGRELRAPLEFDLGFSLATAGGGDWLRLVRSMQEAFDQGSVLLGSPLIAGQYEQLVMTTLLMAQRHNMSEVLQQPVSAAAPHYVKLAEDHIEAHLDQPFTMAELAAVSGVSARSLQTGFQRYRGTTPMDHIRARRLERVHDELLAADPRASSVTDVAMRWGFGHLGKFAQAYRRRFDERPSETLRRLR
jgi:AraC-like DNA-binding protein